MDNWYSENFDGIDFALTQQVAHASKKPRRLWLKPGYEREVVFVSESPFSVHEHNLNIGGDNRNWFTCLRPTGLRCPICDVGIRVKFVTLFSVVDVTGFIDDFGVEHQNGLCLLVTDPGAAAVVRRWHHDLDRNLAGCRFLISKNHYGACTRADLRFLERHDLAEFNFPLSLDLKRLLAPRPAEELEELAAKHLCSMRDQDFSRPFYGRHD